MFSIWFQIENFPNEETNNICDLILVKFNKNNQKIQFSLNYNKLIISIFLFNKLEHPSQNNEPIYKFSQGWNNLTLIIKPKLFRETEFIVIYMFY